MVPSCFNHPASPSYLTTYHHHSSLGKPVTEVASNGSPNNFQPEKGSLDGRFDQYCICKHNNLDWLLQLDEALQPHRDGEVSFTKGVSLNDRAVYTKGDVWFMHATTNL